MVLVEWLGLMTITGLVVLLIAGMWVLKENGEFIITSSGDWQDWFFGIIVAIILIFSIIWAIFVLFYNIPESLGYEKIIVEEETAESEP